MTIVFKDFMFGIPGDGFLGAKFAGGHLRDDQVCGTVTDLAIVETAVLSEPGYTKSRSLHPEKQSHSATIRRDEQSSERQTIMLASHPRRKELERPDGHGTLWRLFRPLPENENIGHQRRRDTWHRARVAIILGADGNGQPRLLSSVFEAVPFLSPLSSEWTHERHGKLNSTQSQG